MDGPYSTVQVNSVDANAGLTQNVSVSSPSSIAFGAAGSPSNATQQNGPGWATTSGSYAATTPTATTIGSTVVPANWGFYLLMAALAYYALKIYGGR